MNDQLSPPLVSVLILAFNHENYIRETLDNILGQQTSFDFEIIVHDDASSDATPKIIKEYQKKYPDIIKPILQKENQFSIGVKPFSNFVYPFLKSEFVAYCEADDYWIDSQKLEKQVAIFRRHKDIVICGHNIKIINEAGVKQKKIFYKKPVASGDFKFAFHDEFDNHFVHTATFMIKTSVIKQQPVTDNWVSGDIQIILFTLSKGMGFYIDQKMSIKRRNLASIVHNEAYRLKVTDGQYKMWKHVLTFCPKKYRKLVKLKIAEYDRLFIKTRRKGYPLLKLIQNALLKDPYWFFGYSKAYKNKLKQSFK